MSSMLAASRSRARLVRSMGLSAGLRPAWCAPASALSTAAAEASDPPLLKKVLIANRGEITCRVIDTCKRLGIPTVAIYSTADANSKHVTMADEAICIGPPASSESYLVIDKILDVIKETGATAVHPGYGFLSENKEFARRLDENGIEFIGPNENAIHYMGDKIESMRIAEEAGVSCAKRYDGECESVERAVELAKGIGYPIIMKASAGGGGKGMRIAWTEDELKEGFHLARTEALSSFGDDRMLIQQFVCPYESRHIEIQVVGDKHGNYAAFPERECSIQRRNQKVIEESPSILLTPETRLRMQQQAVMLAKNVGYFSAGTVEFIADNEQNFYFLEMNTRLQVEHPVTEEVTGVDLVELMIRVAAGEELPEEIRNKEVPFNGWSVESRIYAEDPLRNFLPSIGGLSHYTEPDAQAIIKASSATNAAVAASVDNRIRVDSGVVEGTPITMHYDPMISKLITRADTREAAVALMAGALDGYVIRGVQNNIPFCRAFCDHPKFTSGDISTDFIKDEFPEGFIPLELEPVKKRGLFTAAMQMLAMAGISKGGPPGEMQAGGPGFSVGIGAPGTQILNMERAPVNFDGVNTYVFGAGDDAVESVIDDVDWAGTHGPLFIGTITQTGAGGDSSSERLVCQYVKRLDQGIRVQLGGVNYDVAVLSAEDAVLAAHMIPREEINMSKFCLSPMPGTLVSLAVEVGQAVEDGQELAVVEAMKMQNVLRAEAKGIVKTISCVPGDTLEPDQIIIEFE